MRRWIVAVITALALVFPVAAQAQTTIGSAGPGASVIETAGTNWTGQTFTVPAGAQRLTEVQLAAMGPSPTRTISLHLMTAGAPGPAIQTEPAPTSAAPPNYSMLTLTLLGGGLSVTPGEIYLIRINVLAPPSPSAPRIANYYTGGAMMTDDMGPLLYDTYFTATFANPPSIPTMSEWAMILLGVLLAGGAAFTLQRRRAA